MKFKKLFKEWRIWFLIFWLLVALLSINFQFEQKGIMINSIEQNSSAYIAGIESPTQDIKPTDRERILEINSQKITSTKDYTEIIESIPLNSVIKITTNKETYSLLKEENKSIGISVAEAPSSNLRKGLDLQGGTRVLLKPEEKASEEQIQDVIKTMSNRLNVYGLTDLTIKTASDLEGEKYIVVEIAGASKEEVKDLVAKQGKFEAKIDDKVVFEGGKRDITFVCRTDGTCSRITNCDPLKQGGYACKFEFEISLSSEAANKQAEATKDLEINITETGQRILEKEISFYLDDKFVDSLNIDADLKGQPATRILITGSGVGETEQDALKNTIKNRDNLQTILITGSLPTKIEIVKLDSISPTLGKSFVNNALFVGLLALISVGVIIYIRYRVLKIAIPVIITVASEIFIILGFAALFKYNLDLAAIAGILAAVGTGVDDQIVIADEVLGKSIGYEGSIKQKIKRAFFIILVAYATTVAAMLPLLWAGAGLLTGFAIVIIIGVTIGVFITRPAFGTIIRTLLEQ